jgi:hypothetical protein
MKIDVKFIPHNVVRNNQWDDYLYDEDGNLIFLIGETGNPLYNKVMLVHALVEQLLTEENGIAEESISKFDAEHLESEEPGNELDCPYKDEHLLAEGIERMIFAFLKHPWKQYEEALE